MIILRFESLQTAHGDSRLLSLRIGRPATAMLKGDIRALKGAPESALGNRGAQGSAPESALEPGGCSVKCFRGCSSCYFPAFSTLGSTSQEHPLGSRAPSGALP